MTLQLAALLAGSHGAQRPASADVTDYIIKRIAPHDVSRPDSGTYAPPAAAVSAVRTGARRRGPPAPGTP